MWSKFHGKHVLLLQGPMGPFFRHVAKRLRQHGARISKVNFNVADCVYFAGSAQSYLFRGTLEKWPDYLSLRITSGSVSTLMLFGDCQPYHRAAIACARELGTEVYVFEEGYVRPDYITFERNGVNGNSKLPRDPEFYRTQPLRPAEEPIAVRHAYAWGAVHSITYSVVATLFQCVTPRYRHHRDINCFRQGMIWLRGGFRRLVRSIRDRRVTDHMDQGRVGPYFLVPLQVHLDSQISHCSFRDVSDFIEHVVSSFAKHAPMQCSLIVKDHPLDRPYRNYTMLIERLRQQHGLGSRLLYVDVVALPSALRHANGTVVINSTVGLSSLRHGTPTKCLGKAVYDVEGLTHQGTLDAFWISPGTIDADLLERFLNWITVETQLNGSIWTGFT